MKRYLAETAWRIGSLRQTPASTVLLTGSPRSGTTWLSELLGSLPRVRRVWEPFLSDTSPNANKFNFGLGWRPYLPEGTDHERLYDFFERLLHGRTYRFPDWAGPRLEGSRWTLARRMISPHRTVLKFCRAQRLLPWVQRRFEVPILLLMRHPLAVVASQLHKPALQHPRVESQHPIVSDSLETRWPDLSRYARSLEHFEEKLAATWAFDYMIPLAERESRSALTVTYEQLVTEPRSQLRCIEDHLDVSFDASVHTRLTRPSATTEEDSNVTRGADRLSTWKRRLNDTQVDRILNVVEAFGLDFYTRDGHFDRALFNTRYGDGAPA